MQPFQELGNALEKQWLDANYDESVFPRIAADALLNAKLIERVDPWEIIRWVQHTPVLPQQADLEARFGNPPLTLYMGSRFYIDVYYWLDGTTEIHQHSFSGAFQVLLGSSVHSHYRFEIEREINPHFLLGRIELASVKLLNMGDIHPILAGPNYIHALFHLDRPSATITVRTKGTPMAQPQYSYKKPYVANDPFFKNEILARKVQTLTLLYAMNHPQADDFVSDIVTNSDFQTTFVVLETAFGFLGGNEMQRLFNLTANKDRFNALVEKARAKHGDLVDLLPPVFEEGDRLSSIVRRRATITSEEHRFFLALLLNVRGRTNVLELVRLRFPDRDPVETCIDWTEELSNTRVLGGTESNALGIEGFDPLHLFVFECLLKGLSIEETKAQAAEQFPVGDQNLANVEGIINKLEGSLLFKSLFDDITPAREVS